MVPPVLSEPAALNVNVPVGYINTVNTHTRARHDAMRTHAHEPQRLCRPVVQASVVSVVAAVVAAAVVVAEMVVLMMGRPPALACSQRRSLRAVSARMREAQTYARSSWVTICRN
jgi:hypothetical protein